MTLSGAFSSVQKAIEGIKPYNNEMEVVIAWADEREEPIEPYDRFVVFKGELDTGELGEDVWNSWEGELT